jgi:hypothetical protein
MSGKLRLKLLRPKGLDFKLVTIDRLRSFQVNDPSGCLLI